MVSLVAHNGMEMEQIAFRRIDEKRRTSTGMVVTIEVLTV
jgi:hypothetical protein